MTILVDTNVLLRLYEPADAQHGMIDHAARVLSGQGHRLVVAFQNLTEFWNVCTRPVKQNGYGLSLVETDRRLGALEPVFDLLDEPSAAYPNWRRLVVTHQVRGKQVHDARLVGLMQAHGIDHILTLNGPDFARYAGIVVLDPAAVASPASPPATPPTP